MEPGWTATITAGHNVRMDAVAGPVAGGALAEAEGEAREVECDPVRLAIFSHRYMGIAEQMGRTLQVRLECGWESVGRRLEVSWWVIGSCLEGGYHKAQAFYSYDPTNHPCPLVTPQRTSVSVNIKERLDFSCALFGPDGSLVANAPHLPVHLGAMSEAVRFQVGTCVCVRVCRHAWARVRVCVCAPRSHGQLYGRAAQGHRTKDHG